MNAVPRRYWPYDEITIVKSDSVKDAPYSSVFILTSPWLKVRLQIPQEHLARAEAFTEKLNRQDLNGEDLEDVNWFFGTLVKYPVAYILPRGEDFGSDQHKLKNTNLSYKTPGELLLSLTEGTKENAALKRVAVSRLPESWTWDVDAAIQFSQSRESYDPQALFSIARRFHLLNDIENNKTEELLKYVQSLKSSPEKFRQASAFVLRQNHYVTEQCESVLRASLPTALAAEEEILEFIQAESGHDKILAKALQSLGVDNPESTPVLDSTKALMEVFRFAAKRNLLAFAMITDIFERTTYRAEDPLTTILNEGGEAQAGKAIDHHREINDSGGHENVALEFLNEMTAVDADYAREAMILAELATLVVHQISKETLEVLKG